MDESRIYILLGKRLTHEATNEELAELTQLLEACQADPSKLELLQDVWDTKSDADEFLLEEKWDKLLRNINADKEFSLFDSVGRKKKLFTAGWQWAAASVMLLLTLAAGFFWLRKEEKISLVSISPAKDSVIVAQNGERKKLMLPDSTTVYLNSGSSLTYDKDFGNGNRVVWLNGEAFFEVTKDAAHPFLVNTQRMTIKVLGTVFNVKAYNTMEDIETTVVEGKVEVSLNDNKDKKVVLLPNEKIALKNNEIQKETLPVESPVSEFSYEVKTVKPVVKEVNVPEEIAWIKEKVVFSDEPFELVALKMERWYDVHIHFENEKMKTILMTGDFDKIDIQQALKILQMMVNFKYEIKGKEIFIR